MARGKNVRDKREKLFRIILSVIFGCFIFLMFYMQERQRRRVSVPVSVIQSADFVNKSNIPSSVKVDIFGSEDLIYSVDPSVIEAVVDCAAVNKPGIQDLPVDLRYSFGLVDAMKIEISCVTPNIRVLFDRRKDSAAEDD